jgi:hypothetical protein
MLAKSIGRCTRTFAAADVPGLADIGGSTERIYATGLPPIALKSAVVFARAALAPMLPLILTVMSLKDLVRLLLQAMI